MFSQEYIRAAPVNLRKQHVSRLPTMKHQSNCTVFMNKPVMLYYNESGFTFSGVMQGTVIIIMQCMAVAHYMHMEDTNAFRMDINSR